VHAGISEVGRDLIAVREGAVWCHVLDDSHVIPSIANSEALFWVKIGSRIGGNAGGCGCSWDLRFWLVNDAAFVVRSDVTVAFVIPAIRCDFCNFYRWLIYSFASA